MDQFPEDQSKHLLKKEWLAKVDIQQSKPYLIKFHSSTIDMTCLVMITDTKSVWSEVLNSNQIARRWRACNDMDTSQLLHDEDEEEWRLNCLENLTKVHTLGGMTDTSFEILDSRYSDLAFKIECESFKWRWEACFMGYNNSAEIISTHLVLPLISVNHLAFSAGEPVGELSESALEKAIDKMGRTARRAVDTHIKNALSKPRLATSLRRVTALFNAVSDLPAVHSTVESPRLDILIPSQAKVPSPTQTPINPRPDTPEPVLNSVLEEDIVSKAPSPFPDSSTAIPEPINERPIADDSATESEDSEPNTSGTVSVAAAPTSSAKIQPESTKLRSPGPSQSYSRPQNATSDTDSSPPRPVKKKKRDTSSSDEDSEEERKRRVAKLKNGSNTGRGGARQPLKRGGKRF